MQNSSGFVEENVIQQIMAINYEANKMGIEIDKSPSNKNFAKKVIINLNRLTKSFEIRQADSVFELFSVIDKLELKIDMAEAQNIYYNKIYHRIGDIIENYTNEPNEKDIDFVNLLLSIGEKLNINVDFYRMKIDKLLHV